MWPKVFRRVPGSLEADGPAAWGLTAAGVSEPPGATRGDTGSPPHPPPALAPDSAPRPLDGSGGPARFASHPSTARAPALGPSSFEKNDGSATWVLAAAGVSGGRMRLRALPLAVWCPRAVPGTESASTRASAAALRMSTGRGPRRRRPLRGLAVATPPQGACAVRAAARSIALPRVR